MRILFITATRVGDAVLSTGLIDRLLERYPDARLTLACGPVAAPLFEALPNLERLIVLEKQRYSLHWLDFWRQCVGHRWDVLVDLRRAPLARLLWAGRRFHLPRNRDGVHRVISLADLMGWADDPPAPRLWTAPAHEAAALAAIPPGGPVLALGPAANWEGKTWPAERFAELIQRFTGEGGILPQARVVLFGAAHERKSVLPVVEAVPEERRIDLIGRLDLLEVFAALKRCTFYVGNDSGLMHLAAAAGIPTLGLFGPSREEHYAPWGPLGAAVRTPQAFDEIFPEDYDHRTTPTLMEGLSVDTVETAARALWRRSRETAA